MLFLAMDFDDGDWQKDILTLREACQEFDIPVVIERSRSGKGGHAFPLPRETHREASGKPLVIRKKAML